MTFSIRRMKPEDVEDAVRVSRETLRHEFGQFEERYYPEEALEFDLSRHNKEKYVKDMENADNNFFVADLDGRIIGVTKVTIFGRSGHSHLGWTCIHPSERAHGYGEKMVRRVLDHCREQGCHKISLHTLDNLKAAISLYLKLGFVQEARLRKHYWKVDFLLMSKWFDQANNSGK